MYIPILQVWGPQRCKNLATIHARNHLQQTLATLTVLEILLIAVRGLHMKFVEDTYDERLNLVDQDLRGQKWNL